MRKESEFQKKVINRLKDQFPGCMVLKNDPTYIQGVPDLTVLHNDKWATLEVKKERTAKHRPNQDHYVNKMNTMSYSSFIYPENEEEVFDELERAFKVRG